MMITYLAISLLWSIFFLAMGYLLVEIPKHRHTKHTDSRRGR